MALPLPNWKWMGTQVPRLLLHRRLRLSLSLCIRMLTETDGQTIRKGSDSDSFGVICPAALWPLAEFPYNHVSHSRPSEIEKEKGLWGVVNRQINGQRRHMFHSIFYFFIFSFLFYFFIIIIIMRLSDFDFFSQKKETKTSESRQFTQKKTNNNNISFRGKRKKITRGGCCCCMMAKE